jgi:signal transduction histidine kinase
MNKVYKNLNSINFLKKSYHLKFLFVAFIGIHIPLISIIIFIANNKEITKTSTFFVSLIFTLIATSLTLIILRKLLAPLLFCRTALEEYLKNKTIPVLPKNYNDEAGILMNLIQKSIHAMEDMAKEKQQIATLLSHNLRIPFNQIKGLCEVLEVEKPLNKKVVENIQTVCDKQLINISELLANLNNQLDQESSTIASFSLKKFIKEQTDMVLTEASKKQMSIEISSPEEDIMVHTEEQRLALVFQNLMTNALKFSLPGKTVYVSYKKAGDKVNISVRDEGIGFPEDFVKKIFKTNTGTGRIGTAGEPSNGIGLNLSKKTIQQLGGDLYATSPGNNQGAEFTIVI